MNHSAFMDIFYAGCVVLETTLVTLAFYGTARLRLGYPPTTALAFSMTGTLLTLSLIVQLFFLAGIPNACLLAEIPLVVYCFSSIIRHRGSVISDCLGAWRNSALRRVFLLSLPPLAYLLLQSIVLLPNNQDALVYNLARNLIYADAGTLFPESVSDYALVALPLGNDLLYHLFLRFDTERGLAYFSFFSYLGSILAVYSLVRSLHPGKTAFAAALFFACLPEVVYHATTPKNDLAVVLFALTALLAFAQFAKTRDFPSLCLLALFAAGGISAKSTFLAFAVPFAGASLFWLWKTGEARSTLLLLRKRPVLSGLLFLSCFVFSQAWLFAYNIWAWGTWSGPPFFVSGNVNEDGLFGTAANLCRYFAESLHLTQPVDFAWEKVFGFPLSASVQQAYDGLFLPLFGDTALAQPFAINWSQTEDTWYGPIGFAAAWIGAPAAFFFRKSPAKWAAAAAFVFLFLVAYKVKWWSSNQRYLACFFGLAIVASAPLLESLQQRKLVVRSLYVVSVLVGLHALLFNVTKPFFHFLSPRVDLMLKDSLLDGTNVWNQTRWGREAWWPHSLGDWAELDLKGKTVGIVAHNHHNHFDFVMAHPDARFVGLAHDRGLPKEKYERIFSNDSLKVVGVDYLLMLRVEHQTHVDGNRSMLRIHTPVENTVKTVPVMPEGHTLSERWRHKPDETGPSFVLYEIIPPPLGS